MICKHLFWTGIRPSVQKELKQCDSCRRNKKVNKTGKVPTKLVDETSWNKICVDLIGPTIYVPGLGDKFCNEPGTAFSHSTLLLFYFCTGKFLFFFITLIFIIFSNSYCIDFTNIFSRLEDKQFLLTLLLSSDSSSKW